MGRAAIAGEIGKNLPKDACEFEAMAGEAGGDGHAIAVGVQADDGMVVVGHRVEAGGVGRAVGAEPRKMPVATISMRRCSPSSMRRSTPSGSATSGPPVCSASFTPRRSSCGKPK